MILDIIVVLQDLKTLFLADEIAIVIIVEAKRASKSWAGGRWVGGRIYFLKK